jgi:hypothetical protein
VASNAEESASASEELAGQAAEMQNMVSAFRLSSSGDAGSAPMARSLSRAPALVKKPVGKANGKAAHRRACDTALTRGNDHLLSEF